MRLIYIFVQVFKPNLTDMRKNLSYLIMFVVSAVCIMTSCKKSEKTVEPRITLNDGAAVEFSAEAGSKDFSFNTNVQWYISYEPEEWLSITPQGGEAGDIVIELTVQPNNDTVSSRSASFTIVAGGVSEPVTVTQAAQGTGGDEPEGEEFDPDFLAFLLSKFDTDSDGALSEEEKLAITEITCTDQEAVITSVKGIRELTNLEKLTLSYNSVGPDLDLSGMTALKEVYCDHNLILNLNLSGCSSLELLKANDMTGYILESVDLTGCSALRSLNIVDGAVSELDISDCKALEDINIAYNSISELDFSNNDALVNVTTRRNPMSGFTLDLSGKAEMEYLNCSESQLSGLNVSGCPELQQLIAYANQIPSVDVTASSKLYNFQLYSNLLTSVDLTRNPEITSLDVASNQLTSLDLSGNKKLTGLTCWSNQIGALDLSGCSDLTSINAFNNAITSVNLDGCVALADIDLHDNQLTSIDLSDCNTVIRSLTVYGNALTELDMTGSSIAYLYVQQNDMTSLVLEGCTQLYLLNCSSNDLTELDLTDATSITEIEASANAITSVLFPATGTLVSVGLGGNQLTKVDLRGCDNINSLTLASNKFTQLSLNYLKNVAMLDVSINQIESLDITSMAVITSVFCHDNGMKELYINENANPSQLRVDDGCTVYKGPARDYDDVDTGNWGDTEINPWE